ncbi:actin-binding protein IPP-like [Macrosteles quadrilineatus]|uniref:actin-binding protein IPP-like n=1 Tax=Macrosteles quadrilineatus TaxID=74068 RepID=UPI0023E24A27|nr:actin-binding protein IPP-like [Macrosteles quadrilineatus]XP_054272273.1 actin-binding protein IPP-like [Macrosteles quadrilineatus]
MPPLKENANNNNVSGTSVKSTSPSPAQWYTLSKSKDGSSVDKVYSNRYFPVKVLQNLNNLRQNSRFCDVSIVAGGNVMKVHRAILSASSPYFQAMFSNGLVEEQKETIELHSIPPHILNLLVDFIYTGEITINQDNVQDLIVAADMLELNEVVLGCTEFLKQELHHTNAIGIYRFADAHNCGDMRATALDYIQNHFPHICLEEEFLDLPKDQLVFFLSSELLRVDSEYQVFQAALRWISHDVTQRKRYIFELLKHVRLPLLSVCLLEKTITECTDTSLKIALRSVHNDLLTRKGNLVPLSVFPRLCAKKDIFVIGGSKRELMSAWTRSCECTFESVERFDTFRRRWYQAAPMGIGRILPGVAALNGRIYVVGGEQESQILANGEVYDPSEDSWTPVASMVVPRCEFGLCALGGELYAVGGWVGEDIGGSIERYDPSLDEWMLHGELPEPRFSMGVVSYEGLIYIVGGCTHSRRHLQDLLCFNVVTGEWQNLAPMLVPRSQMGVAVLDGYLYVVGGTNKQNEVLHSVERYSFEQDKWCEVAPMKVGRASPAVAAADSLLYVIGGDQTHEVNFYRAQITIADVECYDPLSNSWTDCPPLPESRSEAGAVVI